MPQPAVANGSVGPLSLARAMRTYSRSMPITLDRAESPRATVGAHVQSIRAGTEGAQLPHHASLDGLRGAAVAAVVGYHLGAGWLKGGFLGVSLFFTLSGFLITNLLLAERDHSGAIKLGAFWARRARRLLPAAVCGIGLAIAVTAIGGTADQLRHLPGDVFAALAYSANWRFVLAHSSYQAGYQAPSALLHYWSLAIEEQLYLVLPLIVTVTTARRRNGRVRLIAVVAGLLVASAAATLAFGGSHDPNRVYFGTDTRMFELLAGVLLAAVVGFPRSNHRKVARQWGNATVAALAVITTLVLWVTVSETDRWLYRGGLWLVAAVSCALIVCTFRCRWLAVALQTGPLAALGRVSYGVYVYHWPLFLLLDPSRTGMHGVELAGLRLAATGAVAALSYRYLEQPIRRRQWRAPRPARFVAVVVPGVALLSAIAVAGAASGRAVAAVARHPIVVVSAPPPTAPNPPVTPVLPPLQRVLFIGDSLVQQAYPTFAARLVSAGVQAQVLGGPGQSLMSHRGAWLGALQQAVAAFDPDVVVLESCCGNFLTDANWVGPDGKVVPRDSAPFYAEWRRLATAATSVSSSRGAAVAWVLGPPVRTNGYYGAIDGWVPKVDAIYQSIAGCRRGVATIDWRTVGGADGAFVESLPNSIGEPVRIRTPDGFHFTPAGWDLLSDITLAGVTNAWAAGGGRPGPWNGPCGPTAPRGSVS